MAWLDLRDCVPLFLTFVEDAFNDVFFFLFSCVILVGTEYFIEKTKAEGKIRLRWVKLEFLLGWGDHFIYSNDFINNLEKKKREIKSGKNCNITNEDTCWQITNNHAFSLISKSPNIPCMIDIY